MGFVYKNGKVVGYEAKPDDSLAEYPNDILRQRQHRQTSSTSDGEYFAIEDCSNFPRRGHLPGNSLTPDGKIVTKPRIRETGWTPTEE